MRELTPPALDPASLDALRDLGDPAFLADLLQTFVEQSETFVANMHEGASAGDLPTFVRAVHALAGSALNIGALRLAAFARELEIAGTIAAPPDVDRLLAELERVSAECEELTSHTFSWSGGL